MIAVDQTKLRTLVSGVLGDHQLGHGEARTILLIAQLAAGADGQEQRAEHAVLHALAQHISSLTGMRSAQLSAIPGPGDHESRLSFLRSVSCALEARSARELAFAVAFLVTVSDLALQRSEHEMLEDLQHALGVDHRRATDLVVQITEAITTTRR